MAVFTPPRVPSVGSDRTVTPDVRVLNFGDGYQQRVPNGLNHMRQVWNLQWSRLTYDQANEIEDFFKARGGHESFTWTPPKESVGLKFRCTNWSRKPLVDGGDQITAQFQQVFDLS